MDVHLRGKVIIVSGATGTLGSAVAMLCAREGACVIGTYLTGDTVAERLASEGIMLHRVDVRESSQINWLVDLVVRKYPKVHALINNAALVKDNLVAMMDENEWDDVISVNLKGVFNFTKAVSGLFMKQREGKIINVVSRAGMRGTEGQVNYCASKAAVVGFTKSVARELGTFNVTVNAVSPGFFVSKMNRHLSAERLSRVMDEHLLGRLMQPDEIAQFIVYLLSDKVATLTGQVFCWDSRV
jgi:3-oxoacyl-[acyl-carrier protein] reductase